MLTIILLGSDQNRLRLIAAEWESNFKVSVEYFYDIVTCQRLCLSKKDKIDYLVILNDIKGSSKLNTINEFRSLGLKCEIIEEDNESIIEACNEIFKLGNLSNSDGNKKGFIRIPLYSFMAFNVSPCDLYIKLGKEQFVKIIHRDEIFSREILSKYKNKSIEHLYINNADLETYLKDYYLLLKHMIHSKSGASNSEIKIASLMFINENLNTIEIEKEILELAQEATNSIIQELSGTRDVQSKIQEFFKSGNHLAEHSIGAAILSHSIAQKMNLNNTFTIKKLIVAALFHDIGLKDHNLSSIDVKKDKSYNDLNQDKRKEIDDHILISLGFLERLKDIPSNTGNIIWEHHERPDGSGFPRGLDAHSISPLSCIFIIAEHFYQMLCIKGFSTDSRNKILQEMSIDFSKGNFKGPMNALLALFF